jgi:hypothetical protein
VAGAPLRVTVQENCPRRAKQLCNSDEARRKRGNDTRDAVQQVTHENKKRVGECVNQDEPPQTTETDGRWSLDTSWEKKCEVQTIPRK